MLKWYIQNEHSRYICISGDEAGTILLYNKQSLATIFGPCTRDYIDGVCRGMEIGLGEKFKPVSIINVTQPTTHVGT